MEFLRRHLAMLQQLGVATEIAATLLPERISNQIRAKGSQHE